MAKDPAFLFYSNDFLTGTYTMSDEQVGKYIRLLCLQHQKGSLTEKDMMIICKSYDEDIWLKFENIDGRYVQKRLADEVEKRKKYSESRANNRKSNKSASKDMNNICKTYDRHMENENEDENKDVVRDDNRGVQGGILCKGSTVQEELLNADSWHKLIAIQTKKPLSYVLEKLKDWILLADVQEYFDKDFQEIRRHFVNWLNKKIEHESANNNRKPANRDDDRQREFEKALTLRPHG